MPTDTFVVCKLSLRFLPLLKRVFLGLLDQNENDKKRFSMETEVFKHQSQVFHMGIHVNGDVEEEEGRYFQCLDFQLPPTLALEEAKNF